MTTTRPLSVAEASSRTGIPKRTIIDAITRRKLNAHKLPGVTAPYLINESDLTGWVDGRADVALTNDNPEATA